MVKSVKESGKKAGPGKTERGRKAGKKSDAGMSEKIMDILDSPWLIIQAVYLVLLFFSAAFGYWLIFSTLF